jgi:UDP-glucose 4-epimerase
VSGYLVTGGAGFIGSHIVEALLARGERVRVLDNFSTGNRSNLAGLTAIEIIEGDIRDERLVQDALHDIDYVIHQAAVVSVPQSMSDPATTHTVNVDGTLNLLKAARQAGIKRMVLASSCAVYGDNADLPLTEMSQTKPLSPYSASKLIGEVYCQTYQRAFGVPTVCLRYFNIYGPRQDPNGAYAAAIPKFVQRMTNGQAPVIYGDGQQTRDFVHVSDVVRANLLACTAEPASGQVLNVATGRGVSLLQLVDHINQLLGTAYAPDFRPPRVGDIKHSCGSGQKLAALLDFTPQVSLRDGLRTTLATAPIGS